MTVFKGYLTLIWRNMGQTFMYLAIVLVVTIMMTSQTQKTIEDSFSRNSVDITVINDDRGEMADGIIQFLQKDNQVTVSEESAEQLSRKLYYREIKFVIRIPKGFTDSFSNADSLPEEENTEQDSVSQLIVSSVPGSAEGQYLRSELEQFLRQTRILLTSGLSTEEALQDVLSLTGNKAEVTMQKTEGTSDSLPGYSYALQMFPYLYLSVLIYAVGTVMQASGGRTVRRRITASPVSSGWLMVQKFSAFGIFFFAVWAASLMLPMLTGHTEFYRSEHISLYLANSLLLLACSGAVAMLVSSLARTAQAISALVNIIGLGCCFMSGVFVPQNIMGAGMRSVGRFLPFYWYVAINNTLGLHQILRSDALEQIRSGFLIQAAFAAALIMIAAVTARGRRQRES